MDEMIEFLGSDLDKIAGDNFNYIQLYFERVLPEYTLNEELWSLYINYMEEKCKKNELKLEFYQRALKNCNQCSEFWLSYMRELEKNNENIEKI